MRTFPAIAAGLTLLSAISTFGEDWPGWRGPDRTDVSKESGLLKDWPEAGPPLVWLFKNAGIGYSGFAVVGDTLYTMGSREDVECLIALNVKDGTEKWATKIGPRLENDWGDGPRDTPTVDGDFVYCLSGPGVVVCASRAGGAIVWQSSMKDLGGKRPNWGYTESVLIDGDKLICTPGGKEGTLAALNKKTGEVIWRSTDVTDDAHYSSVIAVDYNGKHQLIQLMMAKLVGVEAASGKLLWETDWVGKTAVIPTPIFHDGHVYITSGYGAGCKLVKLDGDKAVNVYDNKIMKNHHGGVVLVGDYLYGHSDGYGWVCQNFKTGELAWHEKEKLGKGCCGCVDRMLYLVDEKDGKVVLIEASPEGWKEHGRFTLTPQTELRKPKGKIWTHPVVSNGKLYLRDQELVFCFDVKAK